MAIKNPSSNKIFNIGSLYQWALASLAFVTLPLVFAIIYTVTEVSNYTDKSQQALFQTVNTTENSRIILERLISMERNIRQFQVLKDPAFFKSYQEHRIKFIDVIGALLTKQHNQNLFITLKKILEDEHKLYQDILNNSGNKQLKLTKNNLTVFDKLNSQAKELLSKGEKRVGIEANNLSKIAKRVRKRLTILALLSIPLAIFLGLVFVNLIARPINNLGKAIRNLGDVGFEQPISIKGPKDLTALGHHLEWLRQKLHRLEYEKQQFIRNVSHELKTPLATLKEGTDLLSENVVGELNAEQQDIVQLMKIGNITLNDLVENLLEYQRTISTQIEINYSNFELKTLINRVINEYQLLLRSKNITLNKNLIQIYVSADYDKLKIIISNVFSNALKFSPQNGSIGLTLNSQDGNTFELLIEDQGPGIAKEIQPYIFKDFFQGESPNDWKIKATGLGLALVTHYLVAQKGSIKLLQANQKYNGARFLFQLPLKQTCL